MPTPRKTGVSPPTACFGKMSVKMTRIVLAVLPGFLVLPLIAGTGDVIRTAAELAAATFDRAEAGRTFDITGKMVTDCRPGDEVSFSIEDTSGYMTLRKEHASWSNLAVSAGSRVRVTGFVNLGQRSRRAYARCQTMEILAPGPAPEPVSVSAAEFLSGRFDCRLVSLKGAIRDIVTDEIDPDYRYLILNVDGENISVPLSVRCRERNDLIIGSTIEAVGVCSPSCLGARRQIGRHLSTGSSNISILSDVAENPFRAPMLKDFTRLRPQEIAKLDRHRVCGCVLATWHGNAALLRTGSGDVIGLETVEPPLPQTGDMIEAVGFPESDLYRINLGRVIWRKLPHPNTSNDIPVSVTAADLQTDASGRRRFDPYAHGRAIRLRGIVRNLPGDGNDDSRFNIESGAYIVPVDVSATPDALLGLSVGCEISVAGICVMESENWRPNAPFPMIRGFSVVVRTPADIVVLKRPPWWTPPRLLAVVGTLLVILLGSLVWNALLKRLAERRGRELAQSAIAKAESELKVYERTRLAVELHDSISQYLTGISLAIRAASKQALGEPDGLRQNLMLATTSLDSCRQELRNCLWDLRNQTLDETDFNTAIRQTLEPHLGNTEISIRFSVPRDRFSDNSAHAILHILRELATNAVRHGHATQIKIAGSIEGDRLLFSVRDNGCGFNPETCPGMDRGCFGLQGIRERVNQFEGEMTIVSKPNVGTKVSIALLMPGAEEGKK